MLFPARCPTGFGPARLRAFVGGGDFLAGSGSRAAGRGEPVCSAAEGISFPPRDAVGEVKSRRRNFFFPRVVWRRRGRGTETFQVPAPPPAAECARPECGSPLPAAGSIVSDAVSPRRPWPPLPPPGAERRGPAAGMRRSAGGRRGAAGWPPGDAGSVSPAAGAEARLQLGESRGRRVGSPRSVPERLAWSLESASLLALARTQRLPTSACGPAFVRGNVRRGCQCSSRGAAVRSEAASLGDGRHWGGCCCVDFAFTLKPTKSGLGKVPSRFS